MTRVPPELREQVRNRANGRCEYCHLPEYFSTNAFHADHVISIKQGGPTSLDNLAYACPQCNQFKGSDIAAYDDITQTIVPLYNPRTQTWFEHFEMQGAVVVGKTIVGRATVRLLQINHPDQIESRQNLLDNGLW